MSKIKWQRIVPATSIFATFKASRQSKLTTRQDKILAERNLSYDQVFSIDTIQPGQDLIDKINAKIADAVNWDGLVTMLVNAGCPESVAEAQIEAAKTSVSLTAGLNEAVRAYGVSEYDLPADFWGSDDAGSEQAEEVETVEIDLDAI